MAFIYKLMVIKTKLTVPSIKDHLSEIRTFLREHLKDVNLSAVDKDKVILAIDEACVNAMVHGNLLDGTKPVDIELEIDKKSLKVKICDDGCGSTIIPEKFLNKAMTDMVQEKQKGGMGLKLIYSIMDKVEFYVQGKKNICYLEKSLS